MSASKRKTKFAESIVRGKAAEEIARDDYLSEGFTIAHTGKGSDFLATKQTNSETIIEYVEVKTGNAKLSAKQKLFRARCKSAGIRYSVYRVNIKFLEVYLQNKNSDNLGGALAA